MMLTDAELDALAAKYRPVARPEITAAENRARLARDAEFWDEPELNERLPTKFVKPRTPQSEPKRRSVPRKRAYSKPRGGSSSKIYWKNPNLGHKGAWEYRT